PLETNGVAEDIAPQSSAGRQHDRVLHTRNNIRQRVPCRLWPGEFIDGNEFKEYPVIRQQPQLAMPWILGGDEPLGRGIRLQKANSVTPRQLLEQLAVRIERGAAMNNQFESGPNVLQRRLVGLT